MVAETSDSISSLNEVRLVDDPHASALKIAGVFFSWLSRP